MQQPELYIGLMSGTSLDGVDAVLVDLCQEQPRLLAKHYLPFDDALKNTLLSLHLPAHNELHQAQLTGNQLAQLYAAAVNSLLDNSPLPLDGEELGERPPSPIFSPELSPINLTVGCIPCTMVHGMHPTKLLSQAGISTAQISAIGCHGQTIRHCPEQGYTLQIGNAALLAELTGITVVSDFRSRDIAAGGQGAPLVPAFHDHVLRHPGIHRVIVNIGGISNLTNLPPDADPIGFDCGPGNLLMDAWCMQHVGKPYDDNGAWAASGQVLPALLEQMLDEPFFALLPPKSTGRDLFNMAWLQNKLQGNERAEDVQATLLELACRVIAQTIEKHCTGAAEIYLCGGGARNQTLRNRLIGLLPGSSIQTTDALGVDSDYLEAIAFAWLAQQTVLGKPANLPQVTGAKHTCVLGAIYRN